jgi:hypothetical protein
MLDDVWSNTEESEIFLRVKAARSSGTVIVAEKWNY